MEGWNMKFAVGLWAYGKTGDRFLLGGYKDDVALADRLKRVTANGNIRAVELNYPGDVNASNAAEVGKLIHGAGLAVAMVGADLTGDRIWQFGSLTSKSAEIRQKALERCVATADVARSLKCDRINLWLGQDGFDYCFQSRYPEAWARLVEAVSRLASEVADVKVCIEYKPKEPRTHSLVNSAAKALLLCRETGKSNVGVTIDVGHSFNAGENTAEAACLLGEKLFHLHLNDNYRTWDDDLAVGSVHTLEFIELLYWLRNIGYDGYYSLDVFPYREEPERVVEESIEFLKAAADLVEKVGMDTIAEKIERNDTLAVQSLIRKAMFGGLH
ncbi:MAG: sugar phosphate isomerase/epimerase [Candidatus Abyssobacteria bacterium SURF_17]|jgi:xylose isomerase|uniref:Sugar phosphate isomerase/epimerase n=1 Tax=Candidatus Abyssobacteria bacterium SURF_17 TaxID=2093361 RepID=A0A419EWV7_9BACT|nr:MAG: sugar phosphate isomerase/epimerase [Candidatus Abyssubacteria bacterium SURF_17]